VSSQTTARRRDLRTALSQASLGGQEDVMREVIANGTPRMPAFKYHFEPAQIDAIVHYLKTVPPE
jgi:mono/diheme cytochrome c family protein